VSNEYKSEEEALKDAALKLGISYEDIIKQKPKLVMIEGPFGPPQWLQVYSVSGQVTNDKINEVGIGFYKYIYDGGTVPLPGYGIWIKDHDVFKQA